MLVPGEMRKVSDRTFFIRVSIISLIPSMVPSIAFVFIPVINSTGFLKVLQDSAASLLFHYRYRSMP